MGIPAFAGLTERRRPVTPRIQSVPPRLFRMARHVQRAGHVVARPADQAAAPRTSRLQPRAVSGGGVGVAAWWWRASNPRSRRLEGGRASPVVRRRAPCPAPWPHRGALVQARATLLTSWSVSACWNSGSCVSRPSSQRVRVAISAVALRLVDPYYPQSLLNRRRVIRLAGDDALPLPVLRGEVSSWRSPGWSPSRARHSWLATWPRWPPHTSTASCQCTAPPETATRALACSGDIPVLSGQPAPATRFGLGSAPHGFPSRRTTAARMTVQPGLRDRPVRVRLDKHACRSLIPAGRSRV